MNKNTFVDSLTFLNHGARKITHMEAAITLEPSVSNLAASVDAGQVGRHHLTTNEHDVSCGQ